MGEKGEIFGHGENNEDGLIGSIMVRFGGHVFLGIVFGRVL